MSSYKNLSLMACFLRNTGLAFITLAVPVAQGSTVWTGSLVTYTQPSPHDGTTAAQQDRMTSDLWLTRSTRLPMFNAAPPYSESGYNFSTSPENTEWAFGSLASFATLTYDTWANTIHGGGGGAQLFANLPNKPLVLHIISDDIYLSVTFTSWSSGGGYSYQRSTPGAVTPPTPTVNITSPAGAANFVAPGSVPFTVTTSVSSGTITNVAFFGKTNNVTTLLGSVQVSPFNFTANNLAVGSYALTAVATAAGVSGTSAVVNITVTVPVPTVSITNPIAGAVFSAPATLKLGATAAVSSGTVTNVAFFAGTTSLGAAQASPFKVTGTSLGAGSYPLTAVATAGGISTTSAVVNVTVVSPVAVSNSIPLIASKHFSFSYSANVGLTYVVQRSPDLINWSPVFTNVAAASLVPFSDTALVGGAGYYRVVLQPNP